ncbi:hypothetical protein TWF481_000055 [Arthrobotrys musiformis]|uniref:Uncharacterized protein n=1 Tax=Arthrobotrys musiformis TaxID=47236 RepID=A0AAV9WLV0_9PEZI
MHSSRFNFLILALITLVSFCTARTTITIQSCTTRYCANPTKVLRTTRTIHKTARYTVTRWKTSTKYKSTHTLTSTKYATTTKYSTSTVRTVTIYTRTLTTTQTLPNWFFATTPYTVTWGRTVVTTPTYTVPTPTGFLAVDNDPDNSAGPEYSALPVTQVQPDKRSEIQHENLEPRDPANKYASAVTCTKTLLTKTGTSDLWKTTTKTASVTALVWKTITITRSGTKTITANNAPTIRTVSTKWTSVYGTSTETIWTMLPVTVYTTITQTAQTTTVHAACQNINIAPDAEVPQQAYEAINFGPGPNEKIVEIIAPGWAKTCCELCHTYSGPGQCMGNVFHFLGAEIPEEDCPDAFSNGVFMGWEFCPNDPDDFMRCQLVISEGDDTCSAQTFELRPYVFGKSRYKHVSNGPACARYKYAGLAPPPT